MPRDRFIKLSAEFDAPTLGVSRLRVVLDSDEETKWVEFRCEPEGRDETYLMFFVTPMQMDRLTEWWQAHAENR